MTEENWKCNNCGASEHAAIVLGELEIDVTCASVYITPTDGGDGFAFDHDDFEKVVEHFDSSAFPNERR